jgi:Zn-dependent M16 (insulinase) family peptidase
MIKGVVFNEMKGAMGSQSARFGRELGAALFPASTYHHNSGGEPAAIPNLTWEQLRAFHATHYHPSNARFVTYGDLPLEPTLAKAEVGVLRKLLIWLASEVLFCFVVGFVRVHWRQWF